MYSSFINQLTNDQKFYGLIKVICNVTDSLKSCRCSHNHNTELCSTCQFVKREALKLSYLFPGDKLNTSNAIAVLSYLKQFPETIKLQEGFND